MKTIRSVSFSLIAALCSFAGLSASAQLDVDCDSAAERVKAAVEAKPENVLTVVEDALVAYNGCVGEIVGTAIESSKADAGLVKQIVMVAITASEKDSAEIAESAVAAAPDHADSVREAFAEVFENKKQNAVASNGDQPKQGSSHGKEAVAETTELAGKTSKSTSQHPAEPREQSYDSPSGGKTVVYEQSGKEVVYDSGKQVIYDDGKVVIEPPIPDPGIGRSNDGAGYGPIDISGVYMIPPVASAAPIVEEKEVRRVIRFVPKVRRVYRSVPMSPTHP
ncbi:MAG: hypothetical protein HKN23_01045 [Verrucomicrobiales bacterium]|nr:hypothetical protein [Verrucomicrobiales bacterium]